MFFLKTEKKKNIEQFADQHNSKIKMVKKRSIISLQLAIDFCLDSGHSYLDTSIEGPFSSEEDKIGREMLQES